MTRALFALIAATAFAQSPAPQQPAPAPRPGVITIFRDKGTGAGSLFFSNKDQFPKHWHPDIEIDGTHVLDFHPDSFVSFEVPAGRHLVEFTKFSGVSAQFELHPGERVFVRPGWSGGAYVGNPKSTLTVVPCAEAIKIGKELQPLPAKYVANMAALPETAFPNNCPSE